ncbi:prolactin [Dunckerocampus dactyliophorus]|uniref:prolactin n=1 Tax=Dunckerocampus dactyliophorus TaxID=161453 RepID=UPI002405AF34|nr:prolactin [Dunckerocampus dactyliophorus]
MAHRASNGRKMFVTVLYIVTVCSGVPISDLLDRASQHSDKLHSLSTTLTHELDSHFPAIGRMVMPRPSVCHTSSLQTPSDKEQALQVPDADLLSLARSLLQAWVDPLGILSSSAYTLPHLAQSKLLNKIQELQEQSKSLGDGLNVLSGKMDQAAQTIYSLPYRGGNDIGQDKLAKLNKFHFLLSCFRRDSHKIDSFLKVLRCRAAKLQPHLC